MEVKLFGIAKDIVGDNRLRVTIEENINTVGQLKQWLVQEFPAFKQLRSMAIAVNNEYADDEQSVLNADEIALIPPVSGG